MLISACSIPSSPVDIGIQSPIRISEVLYWSDGGSIVISGADADQKHFTFRLDRSMRENPNPEARKLPPYFVIEKTKLKIGSPEENGLVEVLRDWQKQSSPSKNEHHLAVKEILDVLDDR